MTINDDLYHKLAKEWVTAWNNHDLDSIMTHYADDIEFYSQFIITLNNDPQGKISGKSALRDYFAKCLAAYPDLNFKLHHVLTGINSMVLFYDSVNNKLSAELMQINEEGKIITVRAHYCAK